MQGVPLRVGYQYALDKGSTVTTVSGMINLIMGNRFFIPYHSFCFFGGNQSISFLILTIYVC